MVPGRDFLLRASGKNAMAAKRGEEKTKSRKADSDTDGVLWPRDAARAKAKDCGGLWRADDAWLST